MHARPRVVHQARGQRRPGHASATPATQAPAGRLLPAVLQPPLVRLPLRGQPVDGGSAQLAVDGRVADGERLLDAHLLVLLLHQEQLQLSQAGHAVRVPHLAAHVVEVVVLAAPRAPRQRRDARHHVRRVHHAPSGGHACVVLVEEGAVAHARLAERVHDGVAQQRLAVFQDGVVVRGHGEEVGGQHRQRAAQRVADHEHAELGVLHARRQHQVLQRHVAVRVWLAALGERAECVVEVAHRVRLRRRIRCRRCRRLVRVRHALRRNGHAPRLLRLRHQLLPVVAPPERHKDAACSLVHSHIRPHRVLMLGRRPVLAELAVPALHNPDHPQRVLGRRLEAFPGAGRPCVGCSHHEGAPDRQILREPLLARVPLYLGFRTEGRLHACTQLRQRGLVRLRGRQRTGRRSPSSPRGPLRLHTLRHHPRGPSHCVGLERE
mmetsp:Transcript_17013/g.54575  ORF Transcript_17013/g.54575 Transcript_17013/m.54575 type:complete len:435 (+) Transcript_17013:517-1821(+)